MTRPDVALDVRETSHMSAGMLAYVRALRRCCRASRPICRSRSSAAATTSTPPSSSRCRSRSRACARGSCTFPRRSCRASCPVPHVVTVHDVIDLEFPQYAKRKVGPYLAPRRRAGAAVGARGDHRRRRDGRAARALPARRSRARARGAARRRRARADAATRSCGRGRICSTPATTARTKISRRSWRRGRRCRIATRST